MIIESNKISIKRTYLHGFHLIDDIICGGEVAIPNKVAKDNKNLILFQMNCIWYYLFIKDSSVAGLKKNRPLIAIKRQKVKISATGERSYLITLASQALLRWMSVPGT
ncbi:hypothetical protein BDFG_01525 [Blastomyces dermatitidis ATCC 26199]|nr:hypothetical protein BDFG_01525 [Blastomyces dermatitidis ATCC 26199]